MRYKILSLVLEVDKKEDEVTGEMINDGPEV